MANVGKLIVEYTSRAFAGTPRFCFGSASRARALKAFFISWPEPMRVARASNRISPATERPALSNRPVKKAVADKNPTVVLACLQLMRALLHLDDDQGRKMEVFRCKQLVAGGPQRQPRG